MAEKVNKRVLAAPEARAVATAQPAAVETGRRTQPVQDATTAEARRRALAAGAQPGTVSWGDAVGHFFAAVRREEIAANPPQWVPNL